MEPIAPIVTPTARVNRAGRSRNGLAADPVPPLAPPNQRRPMTTAADAQRQRARHLQAAAAIAQTLHDARWNASV